MSEQEQQSPAVKIVLYGGGGAEISAPVPTPQQQVPAAPILTPSPDQPPSQPPPVPPPGTPPPGREPPGRPVQPPPFPGGRFGQGLGRGGISGGRAKNNPHLNRSNRFINPGAIGHGPGMGSGGGNVLGGSVIGQTGKSPTGERGRGLGGGGNGGVIPAPFMRLIRPSQVVHLVSLRQQLAGTPIDTFRLSSPNAASWDLLNSTLPGVAFVYYKATGKLFVAQVGNASPWRSLDFGASWAQAGAVPAGTVRSVAVAPDGRLWANGQPGQSAFHSDDDSTSWTQDFGPGGATGCNNIACAVGDADRIASVWFNLFADISATITVNRGVAWVDRAIGGNHTSADFIFWVGSSVIHIGQNGGTEIHRSLNGTNAFATVYSDAPAGAQISCWHQATLTGPAFAGATTIFRNSDGNGLTWQRLGALPHTGEVVGLFYDNTGDYLYIRMEDAPGTGGLFYRISSAGTRDWTTVAAGDWEALATTVRSLNNDQVQVMTGWYQ